MVTIAGPLSFTVCRPPSTSRVTLTSDAVDLELGGERRLRPAEQRGQHLAGLVAVVVDRLLAEDDKARLFLVDDGLQNLGDRERLDIAFGLHQDAAVGAHGEAGADGFRRLRGADRDADHLGRLAGLFQAQGFLDGDLVERVHRHLDVGELDARPVALDADLDVVVNDPLNWHKNLHRFPFVLKWLITSTLKRLAAEPNGPANPGQRAKAGRLAKV